MRVQCFPFDCDPKERWIIPRNKAWTPLILGGILSACHLPLLSCVHIILWHERPWTFCSAWQLFVMHGRFWTLTLTRKIFPVRHSSVMLFFNISAVQCTHPPHPTHMHLRSKHHMDKKFSTIWAIHFLVRIHYIHHNMFGVKQTESLMTQIFSPVDVTLQSISFVAALYMQF